MKNLKVFVSSVLVGSTLLVSNVPVYASSFNNSLEIQEVFDDSQLPTVNSVEEANAKGYDSFKLIKRDTRNATAGFETWTKVSRATVSTNYNFGKHSQVAARNKVDGYYFSNSTTSWSVGVSVGGVVGISVSATSGSSSGTFLKADSSRWSTVNVYGTLYRDKYTVKKYNGANILQSTRTEYLNVSSACYNKVVYV